jgi:hypothetical protein
MSESDRQILASRRAILLRRGVPAPFVDDIATRYSPMAFFAGVFVVVWFGAATVVVYLFHDYLFLPLGYIYPNRALALSGLFIAGVPAVLLAVIYFLSFVMLPVLLSIAWSGRPGRRRAGEKGVMDNLAFALRERGLKEDVSNIQPDPAFARLADVPSSDAFLRAVVLSREVNWKETLAMGRVCLGLLVAIFAGLWWISSRTYDVIDRGVVEHHALMPAVTKFPLAQASGSKVECRQLRRGGETPAYIVTFNKVSINLFSASNPRDMHWTDLDVLHRVVGIDAYLKSHGVQVTRLTSGEARGCLIDWHGGGAGDQAELRRVLTGAN